MRTRTSHSSLVFFKGIIKRYYWVCLLQVIALSVLYPTRLALASLQPNADTAEMAFGILRYSISNASTLILIVFPVLYGLLSFGYLWNELECLRMHSFPVTRNRLFFEHLGSAFALMVFPYLLTALGILLVDSAITDLSAQIIPVLLWLLVSLFFGSIFLSASVFSLMIIGHPLFAGAFTYIILLLPFGLQQLVSFSLDTFLKGYSTNNSDIFIMTSPLAGFLMSINRGGFSQTFYLTHWVVYSVTACLFISLAYILYIKRDLENVQEMVQFPVLNPILKHLASFCTLLLFGLLFRTLTGTTIGMIPGYFIGGILGFVLAEMILQKNMRCQVPLKELGISLTLFAVVFSLIATDAFKYGSKPIEVDQIRQVYFSHSPYPGNEPIPNMLFDDPTTISAVQELYQQTNKHIAPTHWLDDTNGSALTFFDFAFVDNKGKLFKRHYTLDATLVNDALDRVYRSPEYLNRMIPLTDLDMANVESVHLYSRLGGETSHVLLTDPDQMNALYSAIIKDIKNSPRESFPSYSAVSTLRVDFDPINPTEYNQDHAYRNLVEIYPHYKNTLAVMKKNPDLAKLIITADKVTKIRIKRVSDYDPKKHTSPLDSVELFDENDTTVKTITDPKLIATIVDSPLYNQGKSMDDAIVNIYTDQDYPVYYGYYIGGLPTDFMH